MTDFFSNALATIMTSVTLVIIDGVGFVGYADETLTPAEAIAKADSMAAEIASGRITAPSVVAHRQRVAHQLRHTAEQINELSGGAEADPGVMVVSGS